MTRMFVVQPFKVGRRNALVADMPREARSEEDAQRLAQRLATVREGVVAFYRDGDVSTGDYEDPVVIAKHGRLPAEIEDAA